MTRFFDDIPAQFSQLNRFKISGAGTRRRTLQDLDSTGRIVRRGGDAPREIEVALEVEGQEIQSRSVTIEPNAAAAVLSSRFLTRNTRAKGRAEASGARE